MTDYAFQLPDLAAVDALLADLELTDAEGRLNRGVAYDVIENMTAVPTVYNGGGQIVVNPEKPHNGIHLNIRVVGDADTGTVKSYMTTNHEVATYSQGTRPNTVRAAPVKPTLIENITHPQRVYA